MDVIIKVKKDLLKVYVYEKDKNNKNIFKSNVVRKTKRSYEELKKKGDVYGKQGPCPPGTFYVFYRKREKGDRLELCEKIPRSFITPNHKQGIINTKEGTERTNIQIHSGKIGRGCILIKDMSKFKELREIIKKYLENEILVKIVLDDYWKTKAKRKRKKKMKQKQQEVWNAIARKWQIFRAKPIKEVVDFIKNQEGKILDLGCGSGRNFTKTKGTIYAVDFSEKMLSYAKEYAKEKKFNVITKKASASKLPFEDDFFDRAIFIAALHCIDSEKKRIKVLRELYRVLKPKAKAMLSVWDKDQPRFKKSKKEIMLPWKIKNKENSKNKNHKESKNIEKSKKYFRYYYLYDKDEIEQQLESVGFKIIKIFDKNTKDSNYSKRNILMIIEKPLKHLKY